MLQGISQLTSSTLNSLSDRSKDRQVQNGMPLTLPQTLGQHIGLVTQFFYRSEDPRLGVMMDYWL